MLSQYAIVQSNEAEIIRKHDGLIRALAARFTHGADRKDLEQIGRIALLKAARRWDENHANKAKLWTFARRGVFCAMLSYASENLEQSHGEALEQDGAVSADQEDRAMIGELLGALSDDERAVIRLSLEGKGLEAVGLEMRAGRGLSKSEVWRIYKRAVCKMQQTLTEGT